MKLYSMISIKVHAVSILYDRHIIYIGHQDFLHISKRIRSSMLSFRNFEYIVVNQFRLLKKNPRHLGHAKQAKHPNVIGAATKCAGVR